MLFRSIDKISESKKYTVADLKKEVAKMVKDELKELNKKPLSKEELKASEALANFLTNESTLKEFNII